MPLQASGIGMPQKCRTWFTARKELFSMRKRSSSRCILPIRSSTGGSSEEAVVDPERDLGNCSSCSQGSSGAATAGALGAFVFKGLATLTTSASCGQATVPTVHCSSRSLCFSDATSLRHGSRASSTALFFACWDCLHSWRCSRHLSTACSKCFNFLRRTKVPTSLRKPRPLSSKLACQYRSKRGLTCESSRLQDRTVDPQETALTGGIPSGTPFSSTIWHNDWYKEGQHPSNPGLGAKATASSIPTTGLSVSCLSTMRSTSHNNVVAAASAEECPNACTSKRTL
mmetsp:Transcript_62569/g.202854  ORF Transcript_62569/g.202854 Transcript_62569/m.202854 type:complete len:285 (-) Transcript_62569:200-1054(-)